VTNNPTTEERIVTFQQAQEQFLAICGRISPTATARQSSEVRDALEALEDKLRGKDGYESIRAAIKDVDAKLRQQITDDVIRDIQSRNQAFTSASESLAAITQQAGRDAKGLSLEKSRMVLPALDKSVSQIKNIVSAVENDQPKEAVTQAQTLLALVEQVKAKLTEE